MKRKIFTILLFILFALPVPVTLLGGAIAGIWHLSCLFAGSTFVELFASLFGIIIGGAYLCTYIYALITTRNQKKITYKTFLPVAHCLLAVIYLFMLNPVWDYVDNTKEYFGFTKKDFTVVEELDTHGGFIGDGSYYLILDCSENKAKAMNLTENWNELPLTENLGLIMYGGEKDGVSYGYNLAEDAHMPIIENGYYIFRDRHSESVDNEDDSQLFDRNSYNFSIALYDCNTDRMYYFVYDT